MPKLPLVVVRLILGCGILIVLATASDARAQARKMSLEELTRTSTAVVVGEAESSRSFWNDSRTQILTEVTIRVEEPVTGGVRDEVTITIPGGRVGNTLYEVSDMPVFVDGEEVVVFLWEHPSGKQLVTGGSQGKLQVVRDDGGSKTVVRGGATLLPDNATIGKADSIGDRLSRSSGGSVPIDDLLARIRSHAQN